MPADFLGHLTNLKERPGKACGHRQDGKDGAGFEERVLGGEIEVSRSAVDCPDFAYLPREWRGRRSALPLMGASSMVSEVAPIALFLRHLVVPGSLLVIEEPESRLHPEMQVELTRQLAELVTRGVRVVITTHSEWMMEELSNIVKRSEIPEGKRTGRQKGASLRQDQVGAWLFEPGKRPAGSTVRKVGFDDVGYYPTGLEDVAFTLHNDWVRLSQAAEGCRKRRGAAPQ